MSNRGRYEKRDKLVAELPPIPKCKKPEMFTKEMCDTLLEYQAKGYYIHQIAEAYGCTKTHIMTVMSRAKRGIYQKRAFSERCLSSKLLPKLGDLRVRDVYEPSAIKNIVDLYNKGYGPATIGRAYNVQKCVIARIVKYAPMEGQIITKKVNGVKRELICRGGKVQLLDKLPTAPKKPATGPKPFVKKQSAKGPTPRPVDVVMKGRDDIEYRDNSYHIKPGFKRIQIDSKTSRIVRI